MPSHAQGLETQVQFEGSPLWRFQRAPRTWNPRHRQRRRRRLHLRRYQRQRSWLPLQPRQIGCAFCPPWLLCPPCRASPFGRCARHTSPVARVAKQRMINAPSSSRLVKHTARRTARAQEKKNRELEGTPAAQAHNKTGPTMSMHQVHVVYSSTVVRSGECDAHARKAELSRARACSAMVLEYHTCTCTNGTYTSLVRPTVRCCRAHSLHLIQPHSHASSRLGAQRSEQASLSALVALCVVRCVCTGTHQYVHVRVLECTRSIIYTRVYSQGGI